MKFCVSIHDVAPHTLDDIENIIHILKNVYKINKICLLVIPGLNWDEKQIQKLKNWQNEGIEIAAHGWNHQAQTNKSLYHILHSIFISSDCAEHLSKNKKDVLQIIKKSYNWFISNGFKKPLLYVPPAWALGSINYQDLQHCGFSHYECTTGMIHNKKYCFLPLLGFEEKTYIGALIRRFFNSLNFIMAHFTGLIRIAIHPNDFKLYLKGDVFNYLSRNKKTVLLHELT